MNRFAILLATLIASSAQAQSVRLLTTESLGSTVQAYDADTAAFAACAGGANTLCYSTGAGTMSSAPLTAFALTMLDDANAAAVRTTLGAEASGTASAAIVAHEAAIDPHPTYTTAAELTTALGSYQPLDSDLTAIAAMSTTTSGRSLLDDADASAMRLTLGLGTLATANSIAVGDTISGATATYLPYFGTSGTLAQSSNFAVDATNGYLGVGGGALESPLTLRTSTATHAISAYSAGAIAAGITGYRANGTIAAPTQVTGGQGLLAIRAGGRDNAGAWSPVRAQITLTAQEAFTSTVQSTNVGVSTTGKGGVSFGERFVFEADGNLIIYGAGGARPIAPASGVSTIGLVNGIAPTGSITDGVVLYSTDVASSAELRVRDEAGNVTTLSPHNFEGISTGASEPMAYSYHSCRSGTCITVDMLAVVRALERLDGKQYAHVYADPSYQRADGRIAPPPATSGEWEAVRAIEAEAMASGTPEERARVEALHAQLSADKASTAGALDAYTALIDSGAVSVGEETAARVRRLRRPANDNAQPRERAGGRP